MAVYMADSSTAINLPMEDHDIIGSIAETAKKPILLGWYLSRLFSIQLS